MTERYLLSCVIASLIALTSAEASSQDYLQGKRHSCEFWREQLELGSNDQDGRLQYAFPVLDRERLGQFERRSFTRADLAELASGLESSTPGNNCDVLSFSRLDGERFALDQSVLLASDAADWRIDGVGDNASALIQSAFRGAGLSAEELTVVQQGQVVLLPDARAQLGSAPNASAETVLAAFPAAWSVSAANSDGDFTPVNYSFEQFQRPVSRYIERADFVGVANVDAVSRTNTSVSLAVELPIRDGIFPTGFADSLESLSRCFLDQWNPATNEDSIASHADLSNANDRLHLDIRFARHESIRSDEVWERIFVTWENVSLQEDGVALVEVEIKGFKNDRGCSFLFCRPPALGEIRYPVEEYIDEFAFYSQAFLECMLDYWRDGRFSRRCEPGVSDRRSIRQRLIDDGPEEACVRAS
ncbi:MAG: hypothetical protein GYB36_03630 [Alphaproteobacteria bacterium]|nr:hypothetical protein [Alphaproteobacteria bacterium]